MSSENEPVRVFENELKIQTFIYKRFKNQTHMGMTPEDFFESFVIGNYEDCQQHTGCVRRAFNAAVSASHLADHYFTYNKNHNPSKVNSFNTIGDFVEHLSKNTSGCFRDIRSISNVYKHLYESNDPKKAVHSSISSTGAIEKISFDKNEEVQMIEEEWAEASKLKNLKSKVVFTCKDGQRIDFLPTLDSVIKFWEKLLS
ncbi:MAG: hypothetical protein NTY07_12795 [Bacteroidia bacterium]|nr:hypothetical protein [Bacteroidia bacterium]